MNVANRAVVSLLLVLVIVVSLLLAVAPEQLVSPLSLALDAAQRRLDTFSQIGVSIGSLAVAALAAILLVAELRRPRRASVVVSKTPGGTAELVIESIAMRLKRAAEAVPGIRDASPVVRSRGNGIDVLMRLSTDPEADLPEISKQVMDAVRSDAESRMGIPVKSLRVTFRHSSSGKRSIIPSQITGPQDRAGTG